MKKSSRQTRILVVDDDRDIAEVLKEALEGYGLIDCVSDGDEALKKLGENYYNTIVTDINMPVLNGIEFYKKAVDKYPNIKERFLFLTGGPDPEQIAFLEKNKIKYLLKPSQVKDIKKIVSQILDHSAWKKQD